MDLRKSSFAALFLTFLLFFNFSAVAENETPAATPPAAGDAQTMSPAAESGKKIFTANCKTCHNVKTKVTGPPLMGVEKRWAANGDFDGVSGREWLNRWIRNSPEVLKTGHPYANKVFVDNNSVPMTPFPQLTDEDISNVMAYIDFETNFKPVKIDDGEKKPGTDYTIYLLYALIAVLFAAVVAMGSFLGKLGTKVLEKQGLPIPKPVPIYREKKLIVTIALVVVIFLGYSAVNTTIDFGRQQGYSPEQPMKFPHDLHAGLNEINCQYCHTGAASGKQSNIPSVNVCMNCHKGIKGDDPKNAKYGKKEIAKIYASIGFDPVNVAYIKDYANMDKKEAEKMISDWLNADAANKPSSADVAEVLQYVQKPIDWVRIHNLPDHVYFNHSQHVTVGGIECQTCHGPVQEMEKVYQFAPLSMGWCVNCHRTTEVNFAANKFYDDYHQLHQDLKDNRRSKITVETIGGTDCQKCHY